MTDTDKLLLIEKARFQFEKNVKAALGVECVDVSIGIHLSGRMYDNAPSQWERLECGGSEWATSSKTDIGHTSVFMPPKY